MKPEEIKQANAMIAQVCNGYRWVCEGFRKPEPLRYLMPHDGGARYSEPISDTPADQRAYYDDKCESVPCSDWQNYIPQYHTDAAALMRVEEWLMNHEVTFTSHFEYGSYHWFAKSWIHKSGTNVNKDHSGESDSNKESKYKCFMSAIQWFVEQSGSIEAAREWTNG